MITGLIKPSTGKPPKDDKSTAFNMSMNAEDKAKEDREKLKSLRSIFTVTSVIKKQISHSMAD